MNTRMIAGILSVMIIGMLLIAGCKTENNPVSIGNDAQGTVDPTADKNGVLDNLTIEGATRISQGFPVPTYNWDDPEISFISVSVSSLAPGAGGHSLIVPRRRLADLAPGLPSMAQIGTLQKSETGMDDPEHRLVVLSPGQTKIEPLMGISPSLAQPNSCTLNITVKGAAGYYSVRNCISADGSTAQASIKVGQNIRPGTFQIQVNVSDKSVNPARTTNTIVIDVVIGKSPSSDPKTLIVGTWTVTDQAPLPPYFPWDHRGEVDTYKSDGTGRGMTIAGSGFTFDYMVRFQDPKWVLDFYDGVYYDNGAWYPGTKYEIVALNETSMVLTELEGGMGRYLILQRR